MQPLTWHWFLLLTVAFNQLIQIVEARGRGGSGDGDSSGSDGDDDSGSEGSSSCVNTYLPMIDDLDVTRFDNYTSDPNYGGAYYFGEASLKSEIEQEELACILTNKSVLPVRLLGAAFIAPQSPWPQGPKNSIVIGFKAWATEKSLQDFTTSYDTCNSLGDTIFFRTTSWFSYTSPNAGLVDARDSVPLTLSTSQNLAIFRGNYVGGPQTKWTNISLAQWTQDDIAFSDDFCSGYAGMDISLPIGTVINGSVSSDTFALTVTGVVIDVVAGVNVSFTVDFKGAFASANSTQLVQSGQNNGQNGDSVISFALVDSDGSDNGQGRLRALGPMMFASLIVTLVLAYSDLLH
ncbi:hypothetical protein N7504_005841 [Penicillium tannophilum]|nr:hypothetical protein N7504_005841 [Penicillium tannophilum]